MPLKVYRKTTSYSSSSEESLPRPDYIVVTRDKTSDKEYVSMWTLLSSGYDVLRNVVASSNAAGMIIPLLFIVLGTGFVYLQFRPAIAEKIQESMGYLDQNTIALVQERYIENRLQYVSNPGADYFERITSAALANSRLSPDTESGLFQGTFYITIPKLGINRLPVRSNVESDTKSGYEKILETSLAHFKGTSLPISSNARNVVIYGHSVGGSYNPRPNDVISAFTFLPNLQVGDEIIVEIQGNEYKYRMRKSEVVKPDDISILEGSPGKHSLTLFTCWPPGNNNQRHVVVATPV